MKQIDFYKGNKHYSLIVNQIKYLCGPNYALKYELMNIIRQTNNKVELSENQAELYNDISVILDGLRINKDFVLFDVNQYYDLTTDLKMQTKSLINKFFETYFLKNIHFDEIYTIKCLFDSIASEINENEQILKTNFIELTNKQLLKLIIPYIQINDNHCNMYDLNYESIIIFQLQLIEFIAQNNPTKNFIIIVDIPIVSKKISDCFLRLRNTITFVLTDNESIVNDLNDYCLLYSDVVDLADEQFIFDNIYEQLKIHIELEEVYDLMKLIIEKKENARTKYIIDLIR